MLIKHVSLNASTTNCTTFWNEKLWRGVLFLNQNYETKNSSDLQFKA